MRHESSLHLNVNRWYMKASFVSLSAQIRSSNPTGYSGVSNDHVVRIYGSTKQNRQTDRERQKDRQTDR
ncbi:hypothetical protein V3C99_014303 [Haemonchus contortus]|uniref:Transposase n=1 Tax=Haemonchus contortus TaxID=6289 RepID=A0A7I4YUW0_HAECO